MTIKRDADPYMLLDSELIKRQICHEAFSRYCPTHRAPTELEKAQADAFERGANIFFTEGFDRGVQMQKAQK